MRTGLIDLIPVLRGEKTKVQCTSFLMTVSISKRCFERFQRKGEGRGGERVTGKALLSYLLFPSPPPPPPPQKKKKKDTYQGQNFLNITRYIAPSSLSHLQESMNECTTSRDVRIKLALGLILTSTHRLIISTFISPA